MYESLLSSFTGDLSWLIGEAVLLVLILMLILISFFRNVRKLVWFYFAGFLVGILFVVFVQGFPFLLDTLISYRSDWSLVFLTQNISLSHLLAQGVFFFLLYSFMGIFTLVVLELLALLTFRWNRMKIFLKRSFSEPWFVLLFTFLSILMGLVWVLFFGEVTFSLLHHWLRLSAFLFFLQFFIRIADNAYLNSPKLFVEFVFVIGLVFVFGFFLSDGMMISLENQMNAKTFFLSHLFIFFLLVLLLGFISTFFVRAFFASDFFLEHYYRQSTFFAAWTSRLLLAARDRHYAYHRILLGLILSSIVGFVLLLMILREWYLLSIPCLFLGYFLLFYLLDRQDDMMIKGDLVEKRMESSVKRVLFG